eukprot:7021972-Lingulodinium_polyedra.AAC.1
MNQCAKRGVVAPSPCAARLQASHCFRDRPSPIMCRSMRFSHLTAWTVNTGFGKAERSRSEGDSGNLHIITVSACLGRGPMGH